MSERWGCVVGGRRLHVHVSWLILKLSSRTRWRTLASYRYVYFCICRPRAWADSVYRFRCFLRHFGHPHLYLINIFFVHAHTHHISDVYHLFYLLLHFPFAISPPLSTAMLYLLPCSISIVHFFIDWFWLKAYQFLVCNWVSLVNMYRRRSQSRHSFWFQHFLFHLFPVLISVPR